MALLVDRVANVCRIRFVAVVVLAFTGTAASAQQSLDQKAWNAVWDRLAQVLPQNTPTESVHALRVIIPATWATGSEDGLKELQQWASAIPEEQFTIDPTRLKLRLHDVYARAVLDVDLPMPTEAQRTEFRKARTTWDTAYTAFLAKRKAFFLAFAQLQNRISLFANLPIDKLDRLSLQKNLDAIGKTTTP